MKNVDVVLNAITATNVAIERVFAEHSRGSIEALRDKLIGIRNSSRDALLAAVCDFIDFGIAERLFLASVSHGQPKDACVKYFNELDALGFVEWRQEFEICVIYCRRLCDLGQVAAAKGILRRVESIVAKHSRQMRPEDRSAIGELRAQIAHS